MAKLIVHAQIVCKPGHAAEITKLIQDVRDYALSDKEPNTHVYRVSVKNDDPNVINVFEEYENKAGLAEHMANPPFQALLKRAGDCLAEPPVINENTEV